MFEIVWTIYIISINLWFEFEMFLSEKRKRKWCATCARQIRIRFPHWEYDLEVNACVRVCVWVWIKFRIQTVARFIQLRKMQLNKITTITRKISVNKRNNKIDETNKKKRNQTHTEPATVRKVVKSIKWWSAKHEIKSIDENVCAHITQWIVCVYIWI